MKDLIAFAEKRDIAYSSVCAAADYNAEYIGECARRLNERVKYHIGQDRNFHTVKDTMECWHDPVSKDSNFKIIAKGFGNNNYKRDISKALMIKRFKPSLIIQEKSVKLQLFNWYYLQRLLSCSFYHSVPVGNGGLYMLKQICSFLASCLFWVCMIFSYYKALGGFICSMFKISTIFIIELLLLVRFVNFKYAFIH